MLLAIDIGNSHTVFGIYKDALRLGSFRLATSVHRTEDELGVLIASLLRELGIEPAELSGAIIACVVPPALGPYQAYCLRVLGQEPMIVGPGIKTGMPVHYENPRDVGSDRIVNAVAGYEALCCGRLQGAKGHKEKEIGLIVVDFGTATTFDVVSPSGAYLGGAIAPGIVISMEALHQKAAKLPRVALRLPERCVGKTTETSMQSGIIFGYIALVDGMLQRMRSELDFPVVILATGGLAAVIGPQSQWIQEVDDFLTLDGLRILHARNLRS